MSEKHTPDRRAVLKSITVGSTIGFGLSTGGSAEQPPDDTSRSDRGIPFDIEITNRYNKNTSLSIRIFPVAEQNGGFSQTGPPVYKRSFVLAGDQNSNSEASNSVRRQLDITGNQLYMVEISATSRAIDDASTVVGVPEGGIPEYMALILDRSRSGELRAVVAKE